MRRAAAWLVAALLALLMAGCASTPPAPSGPLVNAAWTSGRLSLRVEASAARVAQNINAAFELRGDSQAGELRLVSPLGTSLAHARWAPGQVSLETANGSRSFDSLDELSRQALGEALPLAALPDWLAGRPWPGAAHVAAADGFEQLGWQVQLARKTEGHIEARRAAATAAPTLPAVQLRIKLDAPA